VSDKVPLFLSQVVGYTGNGKGATPLAATAVAQNGAAYPYCILALNGNVATDLVSHGGPKANLNGCNIMSDSSATCTGHNLGAAVGDAHGTNNGCGIVQNSNMPVVFSSELSAGAGKEERPSAPGHESMERQLQP